MIITEMHPQVLRLWRVHDRVCICFVWVVIQVYLLSPLDWPCNHTMLATGSVRWIWVLPGPVMMVGRLLLGYSCARDLVVVVSSVSARVGIWNWCGEKEGSLCQVGFLLQSG